MNPIYYESLTTISQKIKVGEISSVEVTEKVLARIHQRDGQLRAYVRVLESESLQAAARLDRAQAAGQPTGLLHGVPIAIKDLLFTAGCPTGSGTQVMRDFVAQEDGTVVKKLKQAGAIIVGKTQMTEGAWAGYHPEATPPQSPWNAGYWPGTSSSGSAVAVATGLCFGAIGSDTGGSIRAPALCCSVVGIKPTFGRVSKHGAFPLASSLDHLGPMTRSVEDGGLMLQALAGHDPLDPHSLADPVPDYLAAIGSPIRGLKIGIDRQHTHDETHPAVVAMIENALETLRDQGAKIVEFKLPDWETLANGGVTTIATEAALAHAPYYPAQKDNYGTMLSKLLELGHSATAMQYATQEDARARFQAAISHLFETIDLFVIPVFPFRTPTLAEIDKIFSDSEGLVTAVRFTIPYNYAGLPTITLPAGLDDRSMPQAFQLVGPRLGEPVLIQAAHAYETARGPLQHPD